LLRGSGAVWQAYRIPAMAPGPAAQRLVFGNS